MSRHDGRRTWLALGALLIAGALGGAPAPRGADKGKDAKVFAPPSAKVVAAWKKVGAEFGWGFDLTRGEKGGAGQAPTFQFGVFRPGTIRSLPSPAIPFALVL